MSGMTTFLNLIIKQLLHIGEIIRFTHKQKARIDSHINPVAINSYAEIFRRLKRKHPIDFVKA